MVLHETEGTALQPLVVADDRRRSDPLELLALAPPGPPVGERPLPSRGRPLVGKARVDAWIHQHVGVVPHQVEQLVVAQKDGDPSARGARLALEVDEQVHHRAHVVAAISEVPGLDEMRATAAPTAAGVHQPGLAQDRGEAVERAVDVADSEQPRVVRRQRRRQQDRGEKQGHGWFAVAPHASSSGVCCSSRMR